ncbi:hypothetical protein KY329_05550 [Candidatus Woesearchaeota archaeon]|nr:hypothetical protein [Candidatus Woesearchaeota archaeon]
MELPENERRIKIQQLEEKGDLKGLTNLGITIVKDDGTYDCGGYVLKELVGLANEATAEVLWRQKRFSTPRKGKNIILYLRRGNINVQNHGFYQNGWVESKWGNDFPVLKHRIADVPANFGTIAQFVPINVDLKARLQRAVQASIAGRQFPD